jgi:hypothetical protein
MIETAIFAQWLHREDLHLKYARWKKGRTEGEVDLILLENKTFKPQWCVEIKWSNRFFNHPSELNSLMHFCHMHSFTSTLVTTIDQVGNKNYGSVDITYLPVALYAYNVGFNTLEKKWNIKSGATTFL